MKLPCYPKKMQRHMASSDAPGVAWKNQKSDISSREAPGKKSGSSPINVYQKHRQSAGKLIFPMHLIFLSCNS